MLPSARVRALTLLTEVRPFLVAREVEAECHARAATPNEYGDLIRRAAFNLREKDDVGVEVVRLSDEELTVGTLAGKILDEQRARTERFENMLQEKYEALNDQHFRAIVRCRRCGSTEVTWEEKQTRSADEAASLFCVCSTCKNRWVTR